MMASFNAVVFSSPLTSFFLGFLNYFTLSSLYVLLALPLPDIVFAELVSVFNSANTNLLGFFGLRVALPPLTDELVTEARPLFFGVSSDLLSSQYYSAALILANIVVVEAVLALRQRLSKRGVLFHFLAFRRGKTYAGLVISIIVSVVLPWKSVMFGQALNFGTKANAAAYFMAFILVLFFLAVDII